MNKGTLVSNEFSISNHANCALLKIRDLKSFKLYEFA